ncbi:MAG: metallophosphoesterase [Clostridia bacterium]|nr:metallophosphoesterase [Clostridia bacterium]
MKLMHIADLHLDAKMETGLTSVRARERRVELLMTFSRAIDEAVVQGVEAVLLAGDLFDTARVSEKTRRYVGDIVCDHPSLRFFYVAGNHDEAVAPLFANDTPPDNWTAFPSDRWASAVIGGVRISGTSAIGHPGIYDELPVAEIGEFHIVMLHGQIVRTGDGGGEKIALKHLQNRGIDYLALGHEHAFRCEALDKRGLWAYAGCPEGRGFDECGKKGYILVDTEASVDARVTFYPIAKRTLHLIEIDVSGCGSFGEIQERLSVAIEGIETTDMVKAVLTGALSPEVSYDTVHLAKLLNEQFYFARLKDQTIPAIRPEDYAHDVSLKGEFIRTVMASRLSDQEKQRTILCGLRALRGEEVDV